MRPGASCAEPHKFWCWCWWILLTCKSCKRAPSIFFLPIPIPSPSFLSGAGHLTPWPLGCKCTRGGGRRHHGWRCWWPGQWERQAWGGALVAPPSRSWCRVLGRGSRQAGLVNQNWKTKKKKGPYQEQRGIVSKEKHRKMKKWTNLATRVRTTREFIWIPFSSQQLL